VICRQQASWSECVFRRDNGADSNRTPRSASEAFPSSQRFHTRKSSKATGVGLSIAQLGSASPRLGHLGGGEVDKGATIYFSLPDCSDCIVSRVAPWRDESYEPCLNLNLFAAFKVTEL